MEWWDRVVFIPARRVWTSVTSRLNLHRTTGLRKLRQEVRTCEYEDVRVMWEMLRQSDGRHPPVNPAAARRRRVKIRFWAALDWTRSGAPLNLCRSF